MTKFKIDWPYLNDEAPVYLNIPESQNSGIPNVVGHLSEIDPDYDGNAKAEFKKKFNDPWDSNKIAPYLSEEEKDVLIVRTNYSTDWYSKREKTGIMNAGVNAIILCRSENGEMRVLIGSRDIGPQDPKIAQLICGYFDGDDAQVEYLEELHRGKYDMNEFVFSEAGRELDEELLKGVSKHITQSYIVGFVTHETRENKALSKAGAGKRQQNILGFFPVLILGGITCEEINVARLQGPPKDFHEMKNPNWYPLSEIQQVMSSGKITMHGMFDIEVVKDLGFRSPTKSIIVTPIKAYDEERTMMKENIQAFIAMSEYVNIAYAKKQLDVERRLTMHSRDESQSPSSETSIVECSPLSDIESRIRD